MKSGNSYNWLYKNNRLRQTDTGDFHIIWHFSLLSLNELTNLKNLHVKDKS